MSRRSKAQSCLRTPKLPNEPNLKMTFPAKTLAISHFHPFSKRVKNGKKMSISCHFQTVSGHFFGSWLQRAK
jgi:hypothetical protein